MIPVSRVSPTESGEIRQQFMTLLVAQLQNQNPLEPLDNNQMASQLAELSSLEQLENMNSSFSNVLLVQQKAHATGLIGKTVTFVAEGSETPVSGKVDAVDLADGDIKVYVGDQEVALEAIQTVSP